MRPTGSSDFSVGAFLGGMSTRFDGSACGRTEGVEVKMQRKLL